MGDSQETTSPYHDCENRAKDAQPEVVRPENKSDGMTALVDGDGPVEEPDDHDLEIEVLSEAECGVHSEPLHIGGKGADLQR